MRRCVFLAVLLALVLSLSKGQNDTINTTTPTTTATDTTGSSSDTSPTPNLGTTTQTTGSSSYTSPITTSTTTTETTGSTSETDSATTLTTTTDTTGQNDTINTTTPMTAARDTIGSSSDTSPTPNLGTTTQTTGSTSETDSATTLTTTTDTTGSSSDTSPIPNSATTTETTGSTTETDSNPSSPTTTGTTGSTSETDSATTLTTTTDTTGQNDTINTTTPTTTATDTTGSSSDTSPTPNLGTTTQTTGSTSETDSATTLTTTTDTTGQNDTINTTTPTTTATDTTGENDTIAATTPTTTAAVTTGDFCNPDPCGTDLATCVPLNSTFTCQCQYGFYYRENDCHRGKIFPGVITLQGTYDGSVLIVNSMQYEEVLENITQFFQHAFRNLSGFAQVVIVEIQLITESRAAAGIRVTVINLFMENTTANNETVTSAIMNATQGLPIQYTGTTYCALLNCDAKTTVCEEDEFPQCVCQSNFSKTEWDVHSCSGCSKDCFERENMYCAKENGVPTCKCLANFKMKNEICVSCPVGYSGDNCENNSELILIIVGTVFGAIILCLAIAVTVVSIRAKHKQDPEKKKLLRSGYSNPNTSDDRQPTMFPRVRTTTGHANPGYQPNNPYEMRDFDDLYEASREPEGFRMHNRN